jgi:hypothetical protein
MIYSKTSESEGEKEMIWVLKIDTESGDHSIEGYWDYEPSEDEIQECLKESWVEDFNAGTIYHEVWVLHDKNK